MKNKRGEGKIEGQAKGGHFLVFAKEVGRKCPLRPPGEICPYFIMNIKAELRSILKGKLTIVGVGNTMRGDDGFGPHLAECINGKVSADVINAGPTPENHLKTIRNSKPDTILIIDTADFGGDIGNIKLLKKDDIPLYGLSTHNASLVLFFDFLKQDTKADVYMLAVQPARCDINTHISDIMTEKCKELESLLVALLPNRKVYPGKDDNETHY